MTFSPAFEYDHRKVDWHLVDCVCNGTRVTGLDRHTQVAAVVAMNGTVPTVDIAWRIGVTERQVDRLRAAYRKTVDA